MKYKRFFSKLLNRYYWISDIDDTLEILHTDEKYKKRLLNLIDAKFWRHEAINTNLQRKFSELIEKGMPDEAIFGELKSIYINMKTIAEKIEPQKLALTLFKKIKIGSPKSYLDYGCGDGSLALAIGMYLKIPQVCGVDTYKSLHTKVRFSFINTRTNKLLFDDNKFDLITSFNMIHKIPYHIQGTIIADLYRICSSGGYIIIKDYDISETDTMMQLLVRNNNILSDFVFGSRRYETIQEYIYFHSIDEWDELFERAGFAIAPMPKFTNNILVNPLSKFIRIYKKA